MSAKSEITIQKSQIINPMKPAKTLLFLVAILLTSCQKPSRDNPWDELAGLDPQSWAPKNLMIESPSITQRTITWEYSGDDRIEGFKIDRKRGNENWVESYAKLGKDMRSFSDTISPDQSTTYYYKVYAHAGNIKSFIMETTALAAFPAPTNLSLQKLSDISYQLNWLDNSDGEAGFIIERKTTGSDFIVLDTTDANSISFTDPNVFIGKTPINVEYRVKAFHGKFHSDAVVANTNASITAPTNLNIDRIDVTTASISWNNNSSDEISFSIERKHADGDWELIANQSSTTFLDQTFQLNTDVFYRIAAYVGNSNSEFITNNFNSQIPTPNDLTYTINSSTSITLNWNYSTTGHEGYKLERKKNEEAYTILSPNLNPSVFTYTDNQINLEQNNYTYRLSAFALNGFSDYAVADLALPTVTTAGITNPGTSTATGGGNVTAQGTTLVTQRGVCWSTSPNPTIANSQTNNGTGTGSFTSQLTGLSPATVYYVRAYAINAVGPAYGAQESFTTSAGNPPTVTTSSISNITTTTATGGGNVTAQGTTLVTQRGVCWSTSPNPTIANSQTNNGTGTGSFTSQLTGLSPATVYYVRAYAINAAGPAYGAQVIFSTSTVVVEITNPATGKTWMDRNLGANRVAQSSTDAEAYGDLYQWGRLTDGHQNRLSGTTSTLSSSDTPGHGNFILSPNSPYDWRNPQNNNLWQGVNGTNNPCPPGFRIPTEAEWEAERQSWSSNNAAGAFNSPLKLPVAGYRSGSSGSLGSVGSGGYYWSATVDGTSARYLLFYSSSAGMASDNRAYGFSVRCLKD